MRISDWSSDVCSSDLLAFGVGARNLSGGQAGPKGGRTPRPLPIRLKVCYDARRTTGDGRHAPVPFPSALAAPRGAPHRRRLAPGDRTSVVQGKSVPVLLDLGGGRCIKQKHNIYHQLTI